jgi:hypothetical protein
MLVAGGSVNHSVAENEQPCMTTADLKRLYEARPFKPFTIHLADGRNIRVEHPEFIAFAPTGRAMNVFEPDGSFHMLDVMLVTDLHVRANGNSRRKRTTR